MRAVTHYITTKVSWVGCAAASFSVNCCCDDARRPSCCASCDLLFQINNMSRRTRRKALYSVTTHNARVKSYAFHMSKANVRPLYIYSPLLLKHTGAEYTAAKASLYDSQATGQQQWYWSRLCLSCPRLIRKATCIWVDGRRALFTLCG